MTPRNNNERWTRIVRWVITLGCYAYLAYFLYSFEYYDEFGERLAAWHWHDCIPLLWILLLLPINEGLEARKWQLLAQPLHAMTYSESFLSIFIGCSSGFFTPNRIGDPVGRVLYFPKGKRLQGMTRSLVGATCQGMATCLFGMMALLLWQGEHSHITLWAGTVATLFLVLIALVPGISRWLVPHTHGRIHEVVSTIANIPWQQGLRILNLSCLRYIVYSTQLYLMMRIFLVDITWMQACVAIPLNYLIVSCVPSVAFTEVGIRAASLSLCLGLYTHNVMGGALAGAALWIINFMLPSLIGTWLLANNKHLAKAEFGNPEKDA